MHIKFSYFEFPNHSAVVPLTHTFSSWILVVSGQKGELLDSSKIGPQSTSSNILNCKFLSNTPPVLSTNNSICITHINNVRLKKVNEIHIWYTHIMMSKENQSHPLQCTCINSYLLISNFKNNNTYNNQ